MQFNAAMRGLFRKYLALIAGLVSVVLLAVSALGFWFLERENDRQLAALQQEKASAAAERIDAYLRQIAHELGWMMLPRVDAQDLAPRRVEALKLLRQVAAVTEVAWIDAGGLERLRLSRLTLDREDSRVDHSGSEFFRNATATRPFFGAVRFHQGSTPYMTIARRGAEPEDGVIVAEVNLTFVRDVITAIRVGQSGYAYVADHRGNLVAHPDISLVLQRRVVGAPDAGAPPQEEPRARFVRNFLEEEVLSASAPVAAPGWRLHVDLPRAEALQPLYELAWRGVLLLMLAVALAVAASVVLARRMVKPIRELQAGAADIGAGRLDRRIDVRTGDEIEALALQFNTMSGQLRESYATLEQKVEQRTQAAEALRQRAESASLAKSRFLAAASHDLRQPMHALNLYLGALAGQELQPGARHLLANVRQCADTLDGLFEGLLDISKLDANAVAPQMEAFAIGPLLERIGMEFEPQARTKGLGLRVVRSTVWVDSDPALVERIVRNLVTNALRYTRAGRIVVACRPLAGRARLQVHDTGEGIAPAHQGLVFEEFYQVANPERDRGKGLGLGLSIVQRLAALLGGHVRLVSAPGRGSLFEVDLPLARAVAGTPGSAQENSAADVLVGCLVVIVDDDAVVLDATRVLLEQWGCVVVAAGSGEEAVQRLAMASRAPDLLVCDYRLREPENGVLVIEMLREEFNRQVPALVVTGDVVTESLELEEGRDTLVLHKPVPDMVLRAALVQLLQRPAAVATAAQPGASVDIPK